MLDQTKSVTKFPRVIDAVRDREDARHNADHALWLIGDALIAECGPPGAHGVNTGSNDRLAGAAAELKRQGFPKYKLRFLQRLRSTAAAFRTVHRVQSVKWGAHWASGDPAKFAEFRQRAADEYGVPLTLQLASKWVKEAKAKAAKEERDRHPDLPDQPVNPEVLRFMHDAEKAANRIREMAIRLHRRRERLADDLSDENKAQLDDWLLL